MSSIVQLAQLVMDNIQLLILAVISCATFILLLSPLASALGLVDIPGERKNHRGHIPVVGGLAIVVALIVVAALFSIEWPFNTAVTVLGGLLFLFGLADDKVNLSPKLRFIAQMIIALLTVAVGDVHLYFFGDIFAVGDFYLGFWGELLTVLAIVTAINAFNMIDGIDGLLALLLLNLFIAMLLITNNSAPFYLSFIALLAVFLVFNLGLLSSQTTCRKVFMGDAGSMMFGYLVVCLLIDKSQHPGVDIRPVTVLWLIAVPLMDVLAIVIRRLRKGQPVMKADREHLHHIFIRLGFSDLRALVVIMGFAIMMSLVGILGAIYTVPEYLMFAAFMLVLAGYLYFILHAWRFIRLFHLAKNRR